MFMSRGGGGGGGGGGAGGGGGGGGGGKEGGGGGKGGNFSANIILPTSPPHAMDSFNPRNSLRIVVWFLKALVIYKCQTFALMKTVVRQ